MREYDMILPFVLQYAWKQMNFAKIYINFEREKNKENNMLQYSYRINSRKLKQIGR